jgi:ABC-type transport system involved in Fe-S cluster assembly fused permease/ATPase subunit
LNSFFLPQQHQIFQPISSIWGYLFFKQSYWFCVIVFVFFRNYLIRYLFGTTITRWRKTVKTK